MDDIKMPVKVSTPGKVKKSFVSENERVLVVQHKRSKQHAQSKSLEQVNTEEFSRPISHELAADVIVDDVQVSQMKNGDVGSFESSSVGVTKGSFQLFFQKIFLLAVCLAGFFVSYTISKNRALSSHNRVDSIKVVREEYATSDEVGDDSSQGGVEASEETLPVPKDLPPERAKSGEQYQEHFSGDLYIEESFTEELSSNSQWWLNSGAFVYRQNDIGYTVEGNLPEESSWVSVYKKQDSIATDGGLQPQNILRFLKRGGWYDATQEIFFRVKKYNALESADRGESNGFLLFSRYVDEDNLYYAGLRVDGNVIVKKKKDGVYHTLFKQSYFDGEYDRTTEPNLIPEGAWFGIKTEVTDEGDDKVRIKIYIDEGRKYDWKLVGEVVDDGESFGGAAIREPGFGGIRSDFMDVEFDEYRVREN